VPAVSAEVQEVIDRIAALPAPVAWADFDAVEAAGLACMALPDAAAVANLSVLHAAVMQLYALYAAAIDTLPAYQNMAVDTTLTDMRAQIEASVYIKSLAPDSFFAGSDRLAGALSQFAALAADAQAYIKGVYYETLTQALAAAKKGDVVVINKHFDTITPYAMGIVGGSFTVDLNGKTITAALPATDGLDALFAVTAGSVLFANGTVVMTDGDAILCARGGTATVVSGQYTAETGFAVAALGDGTATVTGGAFSSLDARGVALCLGGTLAIRGGTLTALNAEGACVYAGDKTTQRSNTVTISGGTFNASKYGVFLLKGTSATINGGTINIEGPGQAICGNGTAYGDIDVTINKVTVNVVSGDKTGCGVYSPNFDTLTINGGTFNVDGNCVELKAGSTVINGGTFNARGTNAAPNYASSTGPSGSGNSVDVIGNVAYTAGGTVSLRINGGTFTSDNGSALRIANVTAGAKNLSASISGGTYNAALSVLSNLEAATVLTVTKAKANNAFNTAQFTLGATSYVSGDGKTIYASFSDMLRTLGITMPLAITGEDRINAGTTETIDFAFADALTAFATANGLTIDVDISNADGAPAFTLSEQTATSVKVTAPDATQHVTATLVFTIVGLKAPETKTVEMPILLIPAITDATEISAINLLAATATTDLNHTDRAMAVPVRYIVNGVDLASLGGTRFAITGVQVKNPKTGAVLPELTASFEDDAVVLDVAASVAKAVKLSAVVVFAYSFDGGPDAFVTSRVITVNITKKAASFTVRQLAKINVYRNDAYGVPGKYTYYGVPLSVSANVASIEAQGDNPEFIIARGSDKIFYLYAETASPLTTGDKRTPLFTVFFNNGYAPVTNYKLAVSLTSTTPSLKLSTTTVTALRDIGKTATVGLVSSSKSISFSSQNVDTEHITTDKPDVFDIRFADNVLTLTNLVPLTGNAYSVKVLVPFTDSAMQRALALTVSCKAPLSVKPASTSATINLLAVAPRVAVPLKVLPATEEAVLESVNGIAAVEDGSVTIGQLTFSVADNRLYVQAAEAAIPTKSTAYTLRFAGCATASKLSVTVVRKSNTASLSPSSVKLNKTVADQVSVKFKMSDGRVVEAADIALAGVGFVLDSVASYTVEAGVIRLAIRDTAQKGTYKIQTVDRDAGHLSVPKMPVLTLTVVDTAVKQTVKISGSLDSLNVYKSITATVTLSGTTAVSLKPVLSTLTDDDFTLVGVSDTAALPVQIVAGSYNAAKGSFLIAWQDVDAIVDNGGNPIRFYVRCNLAPLDAVLTSALMTVKPAQGAFKISADTVALYKNAPYMSAPINLRLANGYTSDMIASVSMPVSAASAHYSIRRSVDGTYLLSYKGAVNPWLTKSKTESIKLNVLLKGASKAISCTVSVSNIVP
jgi:hypothetical protein